MYITSATTEYKVWAMVKTFTEEPDAYHVVAQFRFLQEALDYVNYCTDRISDSGDTVVLTGPYGMASVYPK
jgi:hypothetical protein